MFRFIFVAFFLILYLILSIPVFFVEWLIGKFNPHARDISSLRIVQWGFKVILKMTGVKVTVIGEENVPDEPVLFIGNHRSFFDILLTYSRCRNLTGYVAKKEMEKIPLLSKWMLNVNCLFLDRNNIKEGLKTILAGIEKVRRGVSVWIFPEGTRNKNEQLSDLLPFKEGSLKIAEKSGCPVVPVAIKGTAEVFEKHIPLICPSHVVIEFGEPFIVKELDPENRKFVGAYTREKIAGMLSEMEKENS